MTAHRRVVLVALVVIAAVLGGCSASRPAAVVVDGDEAVRMIEAGGDLRVVDTRRPEDFEKSRVRGSVNLFSLTPWYDRLKDPAIGFEDSASWAGEFERLGIGPKTRVLIVDAGNPERPGRGATVWYFMQRLGFDGASIVNGGYPALEKAGGSGSAGTGLFASGAQEADEAAAGAVSPRGPAFVPTGRAVFAGTAGKGEVRGLVGLREVKVVDARSIEEYTGQEIFEGNPRGGHIPGSVLVTHRDVFGSDGGLRPREEIRARLKAAGLEPGDEIVTYCQGGGRSAALATAMIYAGYDSVANYFGSFGEWSKDESCPVEDAPAVARPIEQSAS